MFEKKKQKYATQFNAKLVQDDYNRNIYIKMCILIVNLVPFKYNTV